MHSCSVTKSCPTLLWPCGLQPVRFLIHGISGKNTRVGCHFLLQGIFPTWNQTCLLNWQANSLPLSQQGNSCGSHINGEKWHHPSKIKDVIKNESKQNSQKHISEILQSWENKYNLFHINWSHSPLTSTAKKEKKKATNNWYRKTANILLYIEFLAFFQESIPTRFLTCPQSIGID